MKVTRLKYIFGIFELLTIHFVCFVLFLLGDINDVPIINLQRKA